MPFFTARSLVTAHQRIGYAEIDPVNARQALRELCRPVARAQLRSLHVRVDPLGREVDLLLGGRDRFLGALAVAALVAPDLLVGLLRGGDVAVGVVERRARLLEVRV